MHIRLSFLVDLWVSFFVNIYAFYLGEIKECGSIWHTEGAWFFGRALPSMDSSMEPPLYILLPHRQLYHDNGAPIALEEFNV